MITHLEVSEPKWKHFDKTGDVYGRAFGFFYRRGRRITEGRPTELHNPGVYKWRQVYEEKMRPFWTTGEELPEKQSRESVKRRHPSSPLLAQKMKTAS